MAPVAPSAVTAVDVERNEACVPACTAAVVMLRYIPDPVDGEVLEGALGQAFAALDQTEWESHVLFFCPLGFGVLLRSGLLQATADVSLRFARKAQLSTWGRLQCVPNMRHVFDAVLDQSMMRKYKRVVEEEVDTSGINVDVE